MLDWINKIIKAIPSRLNKLTPPFNLPEFIIHHVIFSENGDYYLLVNQHCQNEKLLKAERDAETGRSKIYVISNQE